MGTMPGHSLPQNPPASVFKVNSRSNLFSPFSMPPPWSQPLRSPLMATEPPFGLPPSTLTTLTPPQSALNTAAPQWCFYDVNQISWGLRPGNPTAAPISLSVKASVPTKAFSPPCSDPLTVTLISAAGPPCSCFSHSGLLAGPQTQASTLLPPGPLHKLFPPAGAPSPRQLHNSVPPSNLCSKATCAVRTSLTTLSKTATCPHLFLSSHFPALCLS